MYHDTNLAVFSDIIQKKGGEGAGGRTHMKTSQELQMLPRSLSDCKSLTLNVMIQVSQFVRNSHLCH